jgi:uncharacterized protein YjbJ (UPF0337 family)
MNWDRIEGDWKQTEDDLAAINGKREQLEGKKSATVMPRTW